MIEQKPQTQNLLTNYQKTRSGLEKIGRIVFVRNKTLLLLDELSPDYRQKASGIEKTISCLNGVAFPILMKRREALEKMILFNLTNQEKATVLETLRQAEAGEFPRTIYENVLVSSAGRHSDTKSDVKNPDQIQQELAAKVNELLESKLSEATLTTADIAGILGFKTYEKVGIRRAASELGIEGADNLKPQFSQKDAIRVMTKLTTEGQLKSAVPKERKERKSLKREKDQAKILEMLMYSSEENPISGSALAKAVYGDQSPPKTFNTKVLKMLPDLKLELEKKGLTIEVRKVKDKNLKKRGRSSVREILYYATGKSKGSSDWEPPATVTVSTFDRRSRVENKNGSKFVLSDHEIYAIMKKIRVLGLGDENITDSLFGKDEVKRLLSRVGFELGKNGGVGPDFMKKNFTSIQEKINKLPKDQEGLRKHLQTCDGTTRVLLAHIGIKNMVDNNFWKRLLNV